MRELDNFSPRKILEPEREEVTENWRKLHNE
jgi:hypothetical protein